MPRWLKIASFVLLAAWLPATLHCRIEAAGLAQPHHEECNGEHTSPVPENSCRDDACPSVESTLIKEAGAALAVAAPADCACHLCLAVLLAAGAERVAPLLSPQRQSPPLELAVTWQFVTRAAPPARAPSLAS